MTSALYNGSFPFCCSRIKAARSYQSSGEKFSVSVWPLQPPVPVCLLLLDTIRVSEEMCILNANVRNANPQLQIL